MAMVSFGIGMNRVPPGLETDEGSIMYSASLVADSGMDQYGRTFAKFFMSYDKLDWKQPVLVYLMSGVFKIFGKSLIAAKMVNVILLSISVWFMWKILLGFFGQKLAITGSLVYIFMPVLFHTVRMANEAVLPIFFGTLWLYFLLRSAGNGKRDKYFYMLGALCLGVSMYAYKGMRIIVPVWAIINILWIWKEIKSKKLTDIILFIVVLAPFFLIMPLLEQKYPGAIFDRRDNIITNYREITYYWLENLNPAFLFIKSGVGKVFGVEEFGNYLLSTLPLFSVGCYLALKKRGYLLWLVGIFVFTPVLFFLAGSTGYGHRVSASGAIYIVLVMAGIKYLFEQRNKIIGMTMVVLYVLNLGHFLQYYFFVYPKLHQTKEAFGINVYESYKTMATMAYKSSGHQVFVENKLRERGHEANRFLEKAYLKGEVKSWTPGDKIGSKSLLMTEVDGIADMKEVWKDKYSTIRLYIKN